jgi:hypothetical protein
MRSLIICTAHPILLGDKIEKNGMVEVCSTYGRKHRCIQDFGRKPEGKRSLGRPRRIWEDNIKMDLQEVVWWAGTGLIWIRIVTGGGYL